MEKNKNDKNKKLEKNNTQTSESKMEKNSKVNKQTKTNDNETGQNKKIQEKSSKQEKNSKELVVKKEKANKIGIGKILRKTSLTILLILIIIVACIGINIYVEKANWESFDFTEDKRNSLSDMSKQMLESIDQDVKITIINMSEAEESLANQYNSINNKITVEVVEDMSSRADLQDEYGLTANSSAIIVESEDNYKLLGSNNLYTYDYTTYQQIDTREEAITNAIIDVTTEKRPVVYNLVGHNKYSTDYFYLFLNDLYNEAYDVYDLDLLTKGEVPEDCSVLLITSLGEDITTAERDSIVKYIEKGGKIILFTDPNATGKDMPNFQEVLDEYGISISKGVMLEQDEDRTLYGTSSAILVTVSPYSSVTGPTGMNLEACFMTTGRIDFEDSDKLEELGVEVETLATTSSESFYRTDYSNTSNEASDDDEESPNATVGALLKKTIDEDTTSELIVYSNNIFITNLQIAISEQQAMYALDFYNNEDLAMNSIAYLTDRENIITIRKNSEITTYTVTEQQNTIILAVIFAIPAVIVVIGIIVWQVRRRKK